MSGNKHDNGVLELGTDEIRVSYQEDTPGQSVEDYIEEKEKAFHEQKNKVKKHFSQVFGNPLIKSECACGFIDSSNCSSERLSE